VWVGRCPVIAVPTSIGYGARIWARLAPLDNAQLPIALV